MGMVYVHIAHANSILQYYQCVQLYGYLCNSQEKSVRPIVVSSLHLGYYADFRRVASFGDKCTPITKNFPKGSLHTQPHHKHLETMEVLIE